ncbi:LacI family DNA-binding transcriptional regulator [Metabacillus sp. KIGAM252]|uniref:LacI family DNA-binding transcriptional regulator n=1 Tax=Metabacillus flavus TaxID=2823519 RepID=A0ABS5LD04_9BACI|nr:LacI family DNA-binding transcriptional regulator [Metabacillus flavus]MBS2968468.1 LacI family DNA-binding transcriptional regulator [Metabacillus flavus]
MTTIKDIAKAAGVSVTTVSRALNGYSDVNERTRKKIIEISKELNYSPNILARGLVMNKSKTIGLLVSGFNKESIKDNFTFEVLSGINQYAAETDYDLVLFNTNSTKQREKTYAQLCRERRVDGVIVQGIKTDDPYLQEVVESNIPCVLIDIPVQTENVGFVTTDNIAGAKSAVSYLIELGHKNIAMVNGHDLAFVSQERLEGYKRALSEAAGLSFREELVVNGSFEEGKSEAVTFKLLNAFPEVTAIFCASDLMALGSIKAAGKSGRRVPENLSIIGYDDILLSSYVSPRLTTIAQNKQKLGFHAAQQLIEMLEKETAPAHIILETELKIRESTAKIK